MARLTAKQRKALPASDFAGPNRTFPMNDAAHKKAAVMLQRFASQATRKKIKARAGKKKPPNYNPNFRRSFGGNGGTNG